MIQRFKYLSLVFCFILLSTFHAMAAPSVSVTSFRSSDLDMPCNYDKLSRLLSMDVDELVIDEDYSIDTFKGKLETRISRIVGKDVTIDIRTDITVQLDGQIIPEVFIDSYAPVEYFGGITFDFNGRSCRSAVQIRETAPCSVIENMTITSIDVRGYPLVQQTYITGLYVALSEGSDVKVRNISAKDLSSSANMVIGDSCGNISAVYATAKAGVRACLEIYECDFQDIHNYDRNGLIVLEDTNGIYTYFGAPVHVDTKVHIHDIAGTDYGKRLIKTDCSNLLVENITASSKYHDTLSAVSLNDGDGHLYSNAVIDNVHFTGTTQYVVGSALPDTRISNIFSEISIAPESVSAAVLPSESCHIENLTLRGAQLIASITTTNKQIYIKNVDYDDTMYGHGLYGSSLFLTKDANLHLSDVTVKSDKLSYLFFDNYPDQTSYSTNVRATIDNMDLELNKSSKGWLLLMNGKNHIWDISIMNSRIVFNEPFRGLIGVSPDSREAKSMRLSLKNVMVTYNDLLSDSTIPFGQVILGDNTELSMQNVTVRNNSGKSFASSIYSFYVKNLTDKNTYHNLYISGCNIDECKDGKRGLSVTGENVVWSGGDCITHSDPSTLNSLTRKQRKFTYKDSSGRIRMWTGRKWKEAR